MCEKIKRLSEKAHRAASRALHIAGLNSTAILRIDGQMDKKKLGELRFVRTADLCYQL